jgi:small subunit ribosomal protein S17
MEKKMKENKENRGKSSGAAITRGRTFQGVVSKKFEKRVVVDFERTVRIPKYERFVKKKTRIHARIPEKLDVKLGDYVKVRECRPLSKIIHFQVIEVLTKSKGEDK